MYQKLYSEIHPIVNRNLKENFKKISNILRLEKFTYRKLVEFSYKLQKRL